ncbi:glycosyl transferase family 28 [Niabella ginsenosidivorans]|uniref:Glycosyl transferase family 28 n=1 Tax=Niabella ginsenosidivorans TaxID=1176587 RepID=A0A1A9I5G3_9BACT|nr:glycosyltransferase [Niabella ginsenosidivorans]ANH82927.1 glycosyl transferase family 28 [Niabella ginsenosidivorans]
MLEHKKKNILVAPLDWGLGHTTRCIPVICELLKQGARVWAAGNEVQLRLLQQELPDIEYLHLDGYNVHYSAKKGSFLRTMAKQTPAILKAIKHEREWLQKLIHKQPIDGIISDNRFGLSCPGIPAVFITHQLRIKNPLGKMAEGLAQNINYKWINQFSRCWIPDDEAAPGLAGALSHPLKMPSVPCSYIGPLSRMQPAAKYEKGDHILVLLSGPEPQRSLFEKIIFNQMPLAGHNFVVVRGLPNAGGPLLPVLDHVIVFDHLPTDQLNRYLCSAAVVICRSGYSSIMDISAVGARAILIPTPGQTEQEYLAALLERSKKAVISTQEHFDLAAALSRVKTGNYQINSPENNQLLTGAVAAFLEDCGKN